MKGGMRSEAITDKSDIKAGVVAEVQHREEQKAGWGEDENTAATEQKGKEGQTRERKEFC